MDKRKARRLIRRVKKVESNVNKKIFLKIQELKKDKRLMDKIDNEIKDLKTKEDFDGYIRNAARFAKSDIKAG